MINALEALLEAHIGEGGEHDMLFAAQHADPPAKSLRSVVAGSSISSFWSRSMYRSHPRICRRRRYRQQWGLRQPFAAAVPAVWSADGGPQEAGQKQAALLEACATYMESCRILLEHDAAAFNILPCPATNRARYIRIDGPTLVFGRSAKV